MVRFNGSRPDVELKQTPSEFTVLQIENNQANAELVTQLIARRMDLKLLTATHGLQGIEMARTHQPALILMDMMMPQLSGLDTLTMLHADVETSHIPVIIVSSNAFPGVDEKCLAAGALAYLTKPYKIEDLMALIDTGLRYATATH